MASWSERSQPERQINSVATYATFEISASRWQFNVRLHQFGDQAEGPSQSFFETREPS
jgi:hypothetical protein